MSDIGKFYGLSFQLGCVRTQILAILSDSLYSEISGNNSFDVTLPDCLIAIDQFNAELENEKQRILSESKKEYQQIADSIADTLKHQ